MGIFDFFKNKDNGKNIDKVVWRDRNGRITCPGDKCRQECDAKCPIWCQTFALTLLTMNYPEQAIPFFKIALKLAPDFKDAWANLGTAYGRANNILEANKAFKAAYAIDNKYKNALHGLVMSCSGLGQYEEALKYCDEFESVANKEEADKLRLQVNNEKKSGDVPRQESALDMAIEIIAHSRNDKTLGENDKLPHIPEIMVEAKNVCQTLYKEIAKTELKNKLYTLLSTSMFAGIGAVHYWNEDWNSLKRKGIAETLIEPRGALSIGETVLEATDINLNYYTKKIKRLLLEGNVGWTIKEFFKNADETVSEQMAIEAMQALYIYGMVYQMEKLGMK